MLVWDVNLVVAVRCVELSNGGTTYSAVAKGPWADGVCGASAGKDTEKEAVTEALASLVDSMRLSK